jgi:hypothetical protein
MSYYGKKSLKFVWDVSGDKFIYIIYQFIYPPPSVFYIIYVRAKRKGLNNYLLINKGVYYVSKDQK